MFHFVLVLLQLYLCPPWMEDKLPRHSLKSISSSVYLDRFVNHPEVHANIPYPFSKYLTAQQLYYKSDPKFG